MVEMPKPSAKQSDGSTAHRNIILAVCCAVVVVSAGLVWMQSRAGGLFASTEPDNATLTGNAKVVSDASASGGKAIQFTAPAAPDPPPGGGGGGSSCGTGQIGIPPNCFPAPPAPAIGGKQWQLAWNEEFSGSDYDHSKLTPCFDWNFGSCTSTFNEGREHYDPGQIQVNNGTAKLIAQPHSPPFAGSSCQNSSCTYYSGLLSTARPNAGNGSDYLYKFTYGYVEASLKLPATQGFFTAFWMLPADPSFNYKYEIDILENLGYDNKTMWQTYSYNNRSQSWEPNTGINNNGACPVNDLSGGFHRFGVDWEPTYIAFYIDGTKCGQFNGDTNTISNVPMQIILDMMVDNDWQRRFNEGLLDPTLTRTLEADYMRVYQQH